MITNRKITTKWIATCGLLLALEIILLVFPFLQIELGAFTIVFSALPIAVAAVVLDVRATTILGVAWGAISFSQAFSDAFGTIMLNENFIGTILTLGFSRVLVGIGTSLFYKVMPKHGWLEHLSVALTCFMASFLNNSFFMLGMYVFFKASFMEYIYPILGASVLFNMLPETIVCIIVGTPVVAALKKAKIHTGE